VDPLGLGFWSVVGNFAAGAFVGAVAGFVIGATVAVLSPLAGAIVVGAVVVSTVVHVGALGVRANHGDVSAEEVAFNAGALATGGRGFRSGRGFGKVISEPIFPDMAFELPGFGSSPSATSPLGGSPPTAGSTPTAGSQCNPGRPFPENPSPGEILEGIDPNTLQAGRPDLVGDRLDVQKMLLQNRTPRHTPISATQEGVIWDGNHGTRAAADVGKVIEVEVVDPGCPVNAHGTVTELPVRR